jgi:hypothetical protein
MSLSNSDFNKCNELINQLENTNKKMYDLLLTRVSTSITKYSTDQGYDDLFEIMFENNIYELLIKLWIIELKKENLWDKNQFVLPKISDEIEEKLWE